MGVLTGLSEQLDDEEEFGKSHDVWRWVAVIEVLLNDLFRTTEEEWTEAADS